MNSGLGVLTLKNGFSDHRRIDGGAPWGNFWTPLGPFWVPTISLKVHWINVEGVYTQSLVSNTPYTVLKDFGVQVPPQIDPKSIKNRFQNGSASNEIKVGGLDAQKWFRHRLADRWRCALGQFWDHFKIILGAQNRSESTLDQHRGCMCARSDFEHHLRSFEGF